MLRVRVGVGVRVKVRVYRVGSFILKPAAKIIGGSSNTMKNRSSKAWSWSISALSVSLAMAAQTPPTASPTAASGMR